jgi:hypothetical protein
MQQKQELKKALNQRLNKQKQHLRNIQETTRLEKALKQKEEERKRILKSEREAQAKERLRERKRIDAIEAAQRAQGMRNIIEENRVRLALKSEYMSNFNYMDDDYKQQMKYLIAASN